MHDQSQIDLLVSTVRQAATSSCVIEVKGEFASYFNELGIRVFLNDAATIDDIRALKNKLLFELAEINVPFQWMILFRQNNKSAGELFPDGTFTGHVESSQVALFLEQESAQLEATGNAMPVWAVESRSNRLIAEKFSSKFSRANDIGFSLFREATGASHYDSFIGIIDVIEEHHPKMKQLLVFGLKLTEQVRADLLALGFDLSKGTEFGFIATKQS